MSGYRIESFDGVWLPFYNVEQDQTGGASESPLVRTVNGYADVRGTRRAVMQPATFTVSGIYAAGDFTESPAGWKVSSTQTMIASAGNRIVFVPAGVVDVQEKVDALRTKIGVRGNLVRRPWATPSATQSIVARLAGVRVRTNRRFGRWLAEVEATFEAMSPFWAGSAQSATAAPFVVGGTSPVLDAVLTITGPATAVTITGSGINVSWAGSLASGKLLVIQGVRATADGVATTLTYGAGHTDEMAVELAPGANALTVLGAASWSIAWSDKYL